MNKQKAIKILTEFCRVLIGVIFCFSGIVKAIDPVGGAIKIGEYLSAFGLSYFSWMETLLSFNLAALEFTLGFCLLMAVYRKLITLGILIFMCFMTPLTLYLAIFNPVADCGCFGEALIISNWETFFKNIILLAAAIVVFKFHKNLTSCYTYKAYWFVLLFTYIYCIGFCYQNFTHLPIIDFRPYKVGMNILQMMEIPENAPQDEYLFIYEKDGVKKEFTLEEVPTEDPTWKYIDAKLIRQGFIPQISSFELYNTNQENVAEEILNNPESLFLLIAPKLAQASDSHIDEINNVYDYATEARLSFYGVTSSPEDEIIQWKKNTGADYPFLTADDVLLKTIIRSNPGLVLLKKGTILAKWHYNDIPNEDKLSEVVSILTDKLPGMLNENPTDLKRVDLIAEKNDKEGSLWLRIIVGFTLPLLLIWIYDFFRNRNIRRKNNLQTN